MWPRWVTDVDKAILFPQNRNRLSWDRLALPLQKQMHWVLSGLNLILCEAPKFSHIWRSFRYVRCTSRKMHIKEDLAYDKHTGKMIGFTNLGDINNHLLAFERSIEENKDEENVLAKSMMVFMVRGLFTPLRFTYVQFPCSKVTGDLLFHPFWPAVYRLERMGLKVSTSYNTIRMLHTHQHAWLFYL